MSKAEREITPALIVSEPARGAIHGRGFLEMSGIERVRAVLEGKLPRGPSARLTGLHPTDVGVGMATFAMPITGWWQTGAGAAPAGCMAFAADAALSAAVMTAAPPGVGLTTSEMSMDYLRPATIRGGSVIARARLIHSTRSLGLAEVAVEDARGRTLAHGTSRCVLFPVDLETVPERPPPPDDAETGTTVEPDPYLRPVEGEVLTQAEFDSRPGIDILRDRMQGRARPPIARLFGFLVTAVDEGTATMALPASGWLVSGLGTIYGGAIALFADYACTAAVGTVIPAATAFSPMDLKISFLRPGLPGDGELSATATVVHRGKTIAIVNCEVRNPEGKLLAMANASNLILPGRPWDRPVYIAEEMTAGDTGGQ
jgi:uncharacterized protein (TIGR00369 family)